MLFEGTAEQVVAGVGDAVVGADGGVADLVAAAGATAEVVVDAGDALGVLLFDDVADLVVGVARLQVAVEPLLGDFAEAVVEGAVGGALLGVVGGGVPVGGGELLAEGVVAVAAAYGLGAGQGGAVDGPGTEGDAGLAAFLEAAAGDVDLVVLR